VQTVSRVVGKFGQGVFEPGPGFDIIQFAGSQ